MPVGGDLGRRVAAVQHGLNDPGRVAGAVQAAFVLGNGDELVDEGLLLDDVVGFVVVVSSIVPDKTGWR